MATATSKSVIRLNPEPMIETPAIRLSTEETRVILRVMAAGEPVKSTDYHYDALAELGILQRVPLNEEKETQAKKDALWKRADKLVRDRDLEELHDVCHRLEALDTDRHRERQVFKYALSELGKEIARGISVRMNGQQLRRR